MRMVPALVALAACGPLPEEPPPPYIAPLDGQTGVPAHLDLLVSTGGLHLPDDQPVSDEVIRVVDLDGGGLVRGQVHRDGARLRFRPAEGWASGHRYAWTVSDVPTTSRMPALELPPSLLGEAVFEVDGGLAALDAGIDGDGQLCVLLSTWLDAPPTDLGVELDDVPVATTWALRDEWATAHAAHLLPDDPGASVACAVDLAPRRGQGARVSWGDAAPAWFVLDTVDAVDLSVDERRRAP